MPNLMGASQSALEPTEKVSVIAGRRLARQAVWLRQLTLCATIVVVVVSMFVFAGKALLEEKARQNAALALVYADIERDIQRAIEPRPTGAANIRVQVPDPSLSYCDQPFIDHTNVIRYFTPAQVMNCQRLWGVNRAINRVNWELTQWVDRSWLGYSLAWVFMGGRFDVGSATNGEGLFQETARPMRAADAAQLITHLRNCPPRQSQATPGSVTAPGTGDGTDCDATLLDQEVARIRSAFPPPAGASRETADKPEGTQGSGDKFVSAARARILIESLSLYAVPVLFALLGSLVAVNRRLRRLSDAVRLGLSERARGNTTLVLGAAFGAIISLLAEMLRGGGVAMGDDPSKAVAFGLWPLAFLAGYAVSNVFRMLDQAVDRIFGTKAT